MKEGEGVCQTFCKRKQKGSLNNLWEINNCMKYKYGRFYIRK